MVIVQGEGVGWKSWVLGIVCALLLAGCVEGPGVVELQACDEAAGTCNDDLLIHGDRDPVHVLEVRIVDVHTGNPVDDAAVFLFDGTNTKDRGVIPWFFYFFVTPESFGTPLADTRTGADGIAQFEVPPGFDAAFIAGGQGTTVEAAGDVVAGGDGETTRFEIPLYQAERNYTVHLAPEQLAAATMGPAKVHDFQLHFDEDPTLNEAYMMRLAALEIELAWDNDPTALQWADVYGTLRSDTEQVWIGQDDEEYLDPGAHSETVTVDWNDLWETREEFGALTLETYTSKFVGHYDMEIAYSYDASFRATDYAINFS